ncbi:phosphatase PAP2 family protein [Collinsella sp. zg1085]|uniref:phosphatase PAP2 family protein n=1 Tax=Collinsella sp. zg1085 TaxID=2844380 RepID=UPI001C0C1D1B|nr:phosphatase PAP2 family protein [Collinsella sp. zg1085]QWT18174.1 phosphatase PAP2 family protein [Collinsella sp. zg1085]
MEGQPNKTGLEMPVIARGFMARVRANTRMLIMVVSAAIFLFLLYQVHKYDVLRMDSLAYGLIVAKLRQPWLTPVMEGFSALASPVVLMVLLLVIAAFAPGKRPGWCCAINLGLAVLLNVGIKMLVQRPRPVGFRLIEETGFSFPSGHSMASMAFFGLIVWLIWHYEADKRQRVLLSGAFSLLILMIGISRIYLGVHYASDVLAGFVAALLWLGLYTRLAVPLFGLPPRDNKRLVGVSSFSVEREGVRIEKEPRA